MIPLQPYHHFITIDHLAQEELFFLLSFSQQIIEKGIPAIVAEAPLRGKLLANLFLEPSTRSRLSFASAFQRLGGQLLEMTDINSSSLNKGESLEDTSRMISSYADIMVVRHPEEKALERFTSTASIPVISSGDGSGEHPTQALLDLFTIIREKQWSLEELPLQLARQKITLVGDLKYGRTVHSLLKILLLAAGREKLHFSLISPHPLRLPTSYLKMAQERGHTITQSENLQEGLTNASVIYMTRLQEERFPETTSPQELERYRGSCQLSRSLYERAATPGTPILHPLPRNSRSSYCEITTDLDEHPNLAIFRQAANGIPVRMALFLWLLGKKKTT